MKFKLVVLGLCGVVTSAAFVSEPARAFGGKVQSGDCGASCCYTVPSKADTGDLFYGPENWDWCRDSYLTPNSRVFGMTSKWWGGHGWNDACNTDNPTARFFTSLVALSETAPDPAWPDIDDTGGNLLRWGAGWAARVHDDLRASCAHSKTDIATSSTYWIFGDLGIVSDHVTLWIPNNFYVTSTGTIRMVVSRASTLIHEARHINGKGHNSGKNDSSWGYEGAWMYQATWLAQYAAEGVNAPLQQRCAADDQAGDIVDTRFATDPGFSIDNVNDALCP